MARRPLLFVTLLIALAAPAAAQKTPFKREVDGLIRFFRGTATANHALGDGTCRMTAMVLTAMGHSHRGYLLDAGPYTRNPANFLVTCRRSDGSFADAADQEPTETTRWVLDAMRVLDADSFAAEITAGERWLKSKDTALSAFDRIELDKEKSQQMAQRFARGPVMVDGKPDMNANLEILLTLVRTQMGKRSSAWTATQEKGFQFLMTRQDKGKFWMMVPVGPEKFMKHHDLGLTGMGIASLLTKPKSLRTEKEQRVIDYGLQWIAESQNEMGGFGRENINYTTCAAVMAMAKAKRKEYEAMLTKAQRFIKALQSVEPKGYSPGDRDYGSIGYGGDERGDLSNTQFAVQALKETGLDPQDEAFAKAIVFLQRTQNIKGTWSGKIRDEKTKKPVKVVSGNDGGSAYYPGNSPAGYIELPDGSKIPRSYGSMTYALLKTYTLCGVKRDDPRVIAAVKWIEKNFDLDVNPGADPRLGKKAQFQGLFYYYMVMAQALHVAGIDSLMVPNQDSLKEATPVDWRKDLKTKLASMQSQSGGWLNAKNGRWWEESDLVCTTYAMLALEHCK